VEARWPAALAIITSLTGRFTIGAIVAIEAARVAAAVTRIGNLWKIKGEVIIGIVIVVVRIGVINRVDGVGVDLYTGLYELDIAAPAAPGRQSTL